MLDLYQPISRGVRERAEQNCPEESSDRGDCPEPDRQGRSDRHREGRSAAESPHGVANIPGQPVEPLSEALGPKLLPESNGISERSFGRQFRGTWIGARLATLHCLERKVKPCLLGLLPLEAPLGHVHRLDDGEQAGGNASALAEYRGKLVKLFQECKFPPKKRIVGNAQVRIVVDELGKVVNREIVKSSGDLKVDEAALANVDYALNDCKDEGLPKAPEGLTATDRTMIQGYNFK